MKKYDYLNASIRAGRITIENEISHYGSGMIITDLDISCKTLNVDKVYVVDRSFSYSILLANPNLIITANALRIAGHQLLKDLL